MNEQGHYIYEFGPFRLDAQKRLLLREGRQIKLFPKEFDTLLALVENWGEVLEKDELMRQVWGDVVVEEGNLTRNISHLRKLLGEKPDQHDYIVTVPGQGYRFVAGVRPAFDELILHERRRVTLEQVIESTSDNEKLDAQTNFRRSPVTGRVVAGATSDLPATTVESRPFGIKHHRVMLLVGSFFVVAAAVTFFAWSQPSRNEQPKATTQIPFQQIGIKRMTVNGNPRGATLSPDGKLFAYILADSEGRQSLWLGHIDGGEPVELRSPTELIYLGLTFDPNGSSLYFTAIKDYSSDGTLYKIPVLGGVAEKVKDEVRNRITFSRDGKQFAFVRSDVANRRSVLVVAETKGTAERELAFRPGDMSFSRHSASWSSDGSMIAVAAINNESRRECEVFIVNVADGSINQLSGKGWKQVRRTEWLNDLSGLIVVASETSSGIDTQLWHVAYPNGDARRVVTDLNVYSNSVTLAADSRSLLAVRAQTQSNIWIAPSNDLSNAKQITFDSVGRLTGGAGLDWAPDRRIVFTAFVDQSLTIWAVDTNGKDQKQLLPSGSVNDQLSVTADGRYIVFHSDRNGSSEIWRTNIDGSELRQLTTGGNNSQPHVSPNGEWVFYKSGSDDLGPLWRVSIDGGAPARVMERGASWPRVSPDGKLIACVYDNGKEKLAIFSVDGGHPLKMFELPRLANLNGGLRWSPDGKAVTYRDWANGVWSQRLEGGEPSRLEGLPKQKLYTYGWSRDGKWLAFTRVEELQDIVLIRER